jgi:endoglucanase
MTKTFTARGARALQITGLVSMATIAACDASDVVSPDLTEAMSKLVGLKFLSGGNTGAARQAEEWRSSRPEDAALMDRLARQPVAKWVNEWVPLTEVARTVSRAVSVDATPVFVAYNIPNRDLGSHSAGGAADAEAYRKWIREFAAGLGGKRSIVVLEPDAVPQTPKMSAAAREERFDLLRDAIKVLKAANAIVYLDAGNARWLTPDAAAAALKSAGIAEADGFSLNVSNYVSTSVTTAYGEQISKRTGGKHFIIDTSRNGVGGTPDGEWCNPPGQALGVEPTTRTSSALVDALLWIKVPGESDGPCNGGPRAGAWWADYALGLTRQATLIASR